MASSFDEYMSSLNSDYGPGPGRTAAQADWYASDQYRNALASHKQWVKDNPNLPAWKSPYMETIRTGSQAMNQWMRDSGSSPQQLQWIQNAMAPAYGDVAKGSAVAGGLLRQGYEDAFRARAAGFAGQQAGLERSFGGQVASQGLAPDVAARMMAEQRIGGVQNLAASRAQYAGDLNSSLAELAKGTATEFAGLHSNEAAVMANYEAAIKGAKAAKEGSLLGSEVQGGSALGVAAIALSDSRLKQGCKKVGSHNGIPIYEFRYIEGFGPEGVHRGPMAQDLREKYPAAIMETRNGYLCVRQWEVPKELQITKVA